MTKKMILTRGLPGSGKSTWASEQTNAVRINRDDLRYMMFGEYVLSSDGEAAVTIAQHGMIENYLKNGVKDVIVDDTNLNSRYVRALLKIAQKYDVEVEYKDFIDISVNECMWNIDKRVKSGGRDVPRSVVQGMYDRYIKGRTSLPKIELPTYELKPYSHSPQWDMPWAVIVDIDGTVAKMVDRSPYDYTRVSEDTPVEDIISIVKEMAHAGYTILFTSGRDGSCREDTWKWLKQHFRNIEFELLMRTVKDGRPDWIIKAEIFDNHIRGNYNIRCVFDDRDQVVKMWRKLGLTVAQVAEGDF